MFCEDVVFINFFVILMGGIWLGDVFMIGVFDFNVNGLGIYQVIYIFENVVGCFDVDMIFIIVSFLFVFVIVIVGLFCVNDIFQFFFVSLVGGVWLGVVDIQGNVDFIVLGGGLYEVIYIFIIIEGCIVVDMLIIEIFDLFLGIISGNGSICQGSGDMVVLIFDFIGQLFFIYIVVIDGDVQFVLMINDLIVVFNVIFFGSYILLNVIDGNGCIVIGIGNVEVVLNIVLIVFGIMIICDFININYMLSFSISGGDSIIYQL